MCLPITGASLIKYTAIGNRLIIQDAGFNQYSALTNFNKILPAREFKPFVDILRQVEQVWLYQAAGLGKCIMRSSCPEVNH